MRLFYSCFSNQSYNFISVYYKSQMESEYCQLFEMVWSSWELKSILHV